MKRASSDPAWLSETDSFNKAVLLKLGKMVPSIEERIETVNIESVTFDTLFEQLNFPTVDLLQVDAEGFDFDYSIYAGENRRSSILNIYIFRWPTGTNACLSSPHAHTLVVHKTEAKPHCFKK